jgi:hypothetical protein
MIPIIRCMKFARRYDVRIPELNEMVHECLKTKHLTGRLEHEFEPGGVSNPTGWATLTVDTYDLKLHDELDSFISNLERISAAAPHGIRAMM